VEIFTFLFTDIEGSTALLRRLGAAAYARVLADHHDVIRSGLAAHEGEEVDTQGDAFFAVFSSPGECVAAAVEMQRAIEGHAWPATEHVRVRMPRRRPAWSAWMSIVPPGWPGSPTEARSWSRRRRRSWSATPFRRARCSGISVCTG